MLNDFGHTTLAMGEMFFRAGGLRGGGRRDVRQGAISRMRFQMPVSLFVPSAA